jgi:NAD-dependent SIR2 family protein deacetylase
MEKKWNEVEPNFGHKFFTDLQNMGILKFLISQNIDGLHLKSGIKIENLAEFHGNMTLVRCLQCNKRHKKKGLWDSKIWGSGFRVEPVKDGQPVCPDCGGRIINDIVNFGDSIPMDAIENSVKHSRQSDVFMVVGSSLTVTPAANMPIYALDNGSKLIIINHQETGYDNLATVRFFESAGETLIKILEKVKMLKQS